MLEHAQSLRESGERARRHNPAIARQHYEEAVALFRQAGDPLVLAHTVRHLGDVYREAGECSLAEPCYVEALSLYRANPNPPPLHLANAIRAMAVLRDQTGAHAQAIPLWEEAHALYTALAIEAGIAECNNRLDGR
jgi:tetratricopeptide (TPR) repeat protein